MRSTRPNHLVPATAVLAATMLALTAAPALAEGAHGADGRPVLQAQLVGSMPAPASPTIAGIRPGAAPWVNGPSRVRVHADGRVAVTIRGLVIPPPVGTGVNPIASVVATLVCDDTVRSSTAPFPLSTSGDGATSTTLTVPGDCGSAVVLVQPAGNRAVYIASAVDGHDHDG